MDRTTSETIGLDYVMRNMDAIAQAPVLGARIGMESTSGMYIRKKGPNEFEHRDASENIIILRSQAKRGRKVEFLDERERAEVNRLWKLGVGWFMKLGKESELTRAADQIGEFILQSYQYHIKHSIGETGPLRPVTAATAKRKKRETGKRGLGPLERTGQLASSFVASVKRYKLLGHVR